MDFKSNNKTSICFRFFLVFWMRILSWRDSPSKSIKISVMTWLSFSLLLSVLSMQLNLTGFKAHEKKRDFNFTKKIKLYRSGIYGDKIMYVCCHFMKIFLCAAEAQQNGLFIKLRNLLLTNYGGWEIWAEICTD